MLTRRQPSVPEPVNHDLTLALDERQVLLDRKDRALASFRQAQRVLRKPR